MLSKEEIQKITVDHSNTVVKGREGFLFMYKGKQWKDVSPEFKMEVENRGFPVTIEEVSSKEGRVVVICKYDNVSQII